MSAALVVAIAAAGVAGLVLIGLYLTWRRLVALRSAQGVLLGGERRDLVDFAVSLQGRIDDLHRAVDEVAAGLSRVDRRVDGAIMNTAVAPYNAQEGTGRIQSGPVCLRAPAGAGGGLPARHGTGLQPACLY